MLGSQSPQICDGFLPWGAERRADAVRGPWPSRPTGASPGYGVITQDKPLVVTLRLADNGVTVSDGVEADGLAFDAGSLVTIKAIAENKANLAAAA